MFSSILDMKPQWRNELGCWILSSKVVGSIPTGGEIFPFSAIFKISPSG